MICPECGALLESRSGFEVINDWFSDEPTLVVTRDPGALVLWCSGCPFWAPGS